MMVTMRSSSSEVISPALRKVRSRVFRPNEGTGGAPLVQIDIGLLAHQVGVSAAHALDLSQGIHNLLFTIDVGIEETEDKLELKAVSASAYGLDYRQGFVRSTSRRIRELLTSQRQFPQSLHD